MHLVKAEAYREPFSLPQVSPEILGMAERNSLLLLTLVRTSESLTIPSLADKLDHLRKLETEAAVRAKDVCSRLATKGLPVLPIKSFMRYPYVNHDLDLLAVEKDQIQAYKWELSQLGYHHKPSKSRIREPDKYFYYPSADYDTATAARLHLHKALSWNGVVYLNSADAWARHTVRLVHGCEVPTPSPEDEVLIASAHAIFENAEVRLGEILELVLLLRDEQIAWDYMIEKASERNWSNGLALFLEICFAAIEAMEIQIDIPSAIKEWVQSILNSLSAYPRDWSAGMVFPLRIPFRLCMRVYLSKLLLDLRDGKTSELHRACASYFVFIWLSRWRASRIESS